MGALFLPSLMALAEVCLGLCAALVSDMTVTDKSAISAGGV